LVDISTSVDKKAGLPAHLIQNSALRSSNATNFDASKGGSLFGMCVAFLSLNLFQYAAPLHTAQPRYNLFERAAERDVLPYCRIRGIDTLVNGMLCRGLLSGKMKPDTVF
jgi:aryl-alcohol dehydrogenase-like predicted oxidoreductase